MIEDAMTPERAQAMARDVLAELTGGRRGIRPESDGDGAAAAAAAAEAVLRERFPDLSEYDRTAVLFRINRMLSSRATRAARARAGTEAASVAVEPARGDSVVAEAITSRRQEKGLSLDELAGQVGVASARMRNFELGHRRVPVAILARIAQVLDVDLEWFSSDRTAQVEAPKPAAAAGPSDEAAAEEGGHGAAPVQAASSDPGRDELYDLFSSLPPGMRRAVVGIMREMVAERQRATGGDMRDRRTA